MLSLTDCGPLNNEPIYILPLLSCFRHRSKGDQCMTAIKRLRQPGELVFECRPVYVGGYMLHFLGKSTPRNAAII